MSPGDGDAEARLVKELAELLDNITGTELLGRLAAGQLLREATKGSTHLYGKSLVRRLAEQLKVAPSVLYQSIEVAEAFSVPEMEALAKTKTSKGKALRFNTIHALSKIRKAEDRTEAIKRVVAENLSVRAVRNIAGIAPRNGKKSPTEPATETKPAAAPPTRPPFRPEDLQSANSEVVAVAHDVAARRLNDLVKEAQELAAAIANVPYLMRLVVFNRYSSESLSELVMLLKTGVVGSCEAVVGFADDIGNLANAVSAERARAKRLEELRAHSRAEQEEPEPEAADQESAAMHEVEDLESDDHQELDGTDDKESVSVPR